MTRRISLIILFFVACQALCGQRASVAFWNVENFYDTIPSLFYDDSDYTPDGSRRWDFERYGTKVSNIARVIDDMAADIVGLAEIESETAVRDIVMALKTDYNYIHRDSGDSRGMDVALLYKGDKFFPSDVRLVKSGIWREFLHVSGEMLGERVELIVCHMASNMNAYTSRLQCMTALRRYLEKLLEDDPAAKIIVMGDMNASPGEKVVKKTIGRIKSPYDFMYCPHWEESRSGKGTYWYRNKWYMYDWMLVSPSLARGLGPKVEDAGIFVREYMTEPIVEAAPMARKPLRTFYGREYLGGYSDHLPVYMFIVK